MQTRIKTTMPRNAGPFIKGPKETGNKLVDAGQTGSYHGLCTLAIETGRHAKPKIAKEERKCRYCKLDDVEDEEHFLLKCPLYNKQRLSLYNSVVLNVSAMSQGDVFVYLLGSKEPTTIKALGTFLHNAFRKREKVINHYQC